MQKISNLEAQFIKSLFEAAQWSEENDFVRNAGSIIEDIWDAPEAWQEYNEFYGEEKRDPEKVRTDLINLLPKWGIATEEWMKPYLTPENQTNEATNKPE